MSVMQQRKKSDQMIVKSNALIESYYKLTVREQKIILYLLSEIKKGDTELKTHTLPIKDFCDMLDYKGTPHYSDIKKITENFMSKVLHIKMGSTGEKTRQINWLRFVEYNDREGSVSLAFHDMLAPHIINLKEKYTMYELKQIIKLSSGHSMRIYELMKQWELISEKVYSMEQLRKLVGIEPHKYKEYSNFKLRVLTSAQKEINKKTDLRISFEEIKSGRKVVSIRFFIQGKKEEVEMVEDEREVTASLLKKLAPLFVERGFPLTVTKLTQWLEMAEELWGKDKHVQIYKYATEALELKSAEKPIGLLTWLLEEKLKYAAQGLDPAAISLKTTTPASPATKEPAPAWFRASEEESNPEADDPAFLAEKRKLEEELRRRKQ